MTDSELHMWTHWRDKCRSSTEALQEYYPELLRTSPMLQQLVRQVNANELTIDTIMLGKCPK